MKTSELQIKPSLEEFRLLATRGNLIPVYAVITTDSETPVTVFQKLRRRSEYSFLLESAVRTGEIGRYSFVGSKPNMLFQSNGKKITVKEGEHRQEFETATDPLTELQGLMSRYRYVGADDLPQFSGGALGYLGYDTVQSFEPLKLKVAESDELMIPDSIFMVVREMIAFDHLTRRLYIISNALVSSGDIDGAYEIACREIYAMKEELRIPVELPVINLKTNVPQIVPLSNTTKERYCQMVLDAKTQIEAGDVFQVVLSQRFHADYSGDSLHLYRTLWAVNPSPYMFCIDLGSELSLVGSSPEVHVRAINGKVEIRPIAGTRKRGETPEKDALLAEELLADPKERAEHVMLIDLARNDVGRIAEFGSVEVTDRFQIERFSHVMHIVSNVVGKLRKGLNAYDVMRASFPAGTVSGSPKIRAMQIIRESEGNKRGVYAGAVGYFGFDGNHDSCIALRTVVLKDGKAYVQAGAGIVADSTPEGEHEECLNKAMGMMRAIAQAKAI